MWAYSRFNLALSDSEFWHLTLAQFIALRERHTDQGDWLDYRSAQVCAVIANTVPRKSGTQAFSVDDFMPKKQEKPVELDTTDFVNKLRMLNAAYGGEEKKLNGGN